MNITVNYTLLAWFSTEFEQYSKELSALQDDIKKVQRNLSQCSGLTTHNNLQSINIGVSKQISDIGNLQKAAEDAAEEYHTCEASLAWPEKKASKESGIKQPDPRPDVVTAGTAPAKNALKDAKSKSTDEAENSSISLLDFNDESESHNARLRILGYEKTDGNIDAYALRVTGDDTIDFGAITVGTAVGFAGFAFRGNTSNKIAMFDSDIGTNAKYTDGKVAANPLRADPEYVVSGEEYNGETKQSNNFDFIGGKVSAEVGVTAAVLDYKTTVGNEDISGSVDANVKLMDADIGGKLEASFGSDGLAILGKAEIGASLAEVGGSVSTNIYGIEAGANVSAEIGFGASFEAGYKDGELTFEIGAAFGIGGKVGFSVKLPDLW